MCSVLSVASNYLPILETGFVALGLAGVIRLVRVMVEPHKYWATCNILAGAGFATYYLGGFLTLIQYEAASSDLQIVIGENFEMRALIATLYLSLFYGMLVLAAKIENGFWQDSLDLAGKAWSWQKDSPVLTWIVIYLAGVTAAEVVLMLTGQWSFQGFTAEDTRVPIGPSLVWSLSYFIPSMIGWLIGQRGCPYKIWLLAVASGACQLLWFGLLGRRMIFFGCLAFLIGHFWAQGTKSLYRTAALFVIFIPVLYLVAKLFLAMRYVSYSYVGIEDFATLGNLLQDSWNTIVSQTNNFEYFEQQNYESRLFIFGYLTTVVSDLAWSQIAYGLHFFIAIFTNVPRIFLPDKAAFFLNNAWGADGKTLIDAAIGLPTTVDENFSPFVEAYGDFFWFGAIIYPILLLGIGWIFSRIVRDMRNPIIIVGAFGVLLAQYMSIELNMGSLIATIRPLVFIWIFTKMIYLSSDANRAKAASVGE